jgi:hypothetical protein
VLGYLLSFRGNISQYLSYAIKCKVVLVLNLLNNQPCRRIESGCMDPHFLDLGTNGGQLMQDLKNSVAWVRERTISTERRPLVGEVSANFCADRDYRVVNVTDPYDRILGFLDRSRYFFFQVAPQLYSRGWMDPVPDPLLLRKSGSAGNRTRTSGSVVRNSDH